MNYYESSHYVWVVDMRNKVPINFELNQKNMKLKLSIALVILLWLPYLILGGDASYRIHDNLDSNHTSFRVLSASNLFAGNNELIQGIRRISLPPELNLSTWFYLIIGPLNSYILERLLVALVAFWGMYRWLSVYILKDINSWLTYASAVLFSLVPFWPYGGISVAGLPWVIYVLLNFKNERWNYRDVGVLVFFALYSSLVLSGLFLLIYFGLYWLVCVVRREKGAGSLFLGMVLLSGFYIITHYRLVLGFLLPSDYVSHRVEMKPSMWSFNESLNASISLFLKQQEHSSSVHRAFLLPIVLLAWVISFISKSKRSWMFLSIGMVLVLFHALIFGFYRYEGFSAILKRINAKLPMQLDRFYMLTPIIWYALFAVSLYLFSNLEVINRVKRIALLAMLGIQGFLLLRQHELWVNRDEPSYNAYHSIESFNKIKEIVGSSAKCVSVGMSPSVALYNGLFPIDGYFFDYPLEFKHEFGSIIRGELNRNDKLKIYFDEWGSRAYVFSSELDGDFHVRKGSGKHIEFLKLDYSKLKKQGVYIILSAVPINTDHQPLKLLSVITNDESAWEIHVYRIEETTNQFINKS